MPNRDTANLLSAFVTSVDPGTEVEYKFVHNGANGVTFDGYIRAKARGDQYFTADPPPAIGPPPVMCLTKGTGIHTVLGAVAVDIL